MTDRPTFTLAEAVRASDRSRSTLQRDLKAGRIDGAHRADPADPASPWVIPADGLVAAGYRLHAPTPAAAPGDSAPEPDPSTAVAADLADLRRRAEVAEALAAERATTLADLREALDATRLALRALTAGPDPPPDVAPGPAPPLEPPAPDPPGGPVPGLRSPLGTRFRRAWQGFTG